MLHCIYVCSKYQQSINYRENVQIVYIFVEGSNLTNELLLRKYATREWLGDIEEASQNFPNFRLSFRSCNEANFSWVT